MTPSRASGGIEGDEAQSAVSRGKKPVVKTADRPQKLLHEGPAIESLPSPLSTRAILGGLPCTRQNEIILDDKGRSGACYWAVNEHSL